MLAVWRDEVRTGVSEISYDQPFAEFKSWLDEASKSEPNDANAMTLATVGEDGRPAARMVLLKGVDERGFVFYTNTESRKGRDLAAQPWAALCFQDRKSTRLNSSHRCILSFPTRRSSDLKSWLDEASKSEPNDANAMTLATVGEDGRPAARMVLLKGVDERGFVFYTNTESRKGRDLAAQPWAALCF